MGKSFKGCRHKVLALLLPDKRPRSMEISTVHTCQDRDHECETETEQCGVDETKCDHVEELEQWFSEDFHRQRCEVRDQSVLEFAGQSKSPIRNSSDVASG